jgi:hypothetical protein
MIAKAMRAILLAGATATSLKGFPEARAELPRDACDEVESEALSRREFGVMEMSWISYSGEPWATWRRRSIQRCVKRLSGWDASNRQGYFSALRSYR